jgi:RluA family pseudouridine synthase
VIKLSSPSTREFWEVPILYEDATLLALDKPTGLATVPPSEEPGRPSLLGLLHSGIAEDKPWAKTNSLDYLMNAYRLEAETSGVLLFAKTKVVLTGLLDLFGSEKPSMWFVTLVQGVPAHDRFNLDAKIAPDPVRAGLMRVDSRNGKRARTHFQVLERFAGWTLLECAPLTFRQDQIRVHLRHAKLPVSGDGDYGGKPLLLSRLKPDYHLKPHHTERPLIGKPCLHASRVVIDHPDTGKPLEISSPWPKDLAVALKYLKRYATEQPSQNLSQAS